MSASDKKIVQYLNEANAMEQGMTRVLQAQIAAAPRGRFREGLERHLTETRRHAERVQARLTQLKQGSNPIQLGVGLVQSVIGQAVAVGKAPIDLLRGTGGQEKVLKNAKDACAAESLEIATYTALERLAESVDDRRTAELASSIREDEERMLARLLDELPRLTEGVVRSEIRGEDGFSLSETGAADATRSAGRRVKRSAERTRRSAGGAARRKAGAATRKAARAASGGSSRRSRSSAGGTAKSSRASSGAATRRRATSSSGRSSGRSSTARSSSSRQSRPGNGRANEPWPGYDELNVDEVRSALDGADERRVREVRTYERGHKDRTGVIEKAEHDLAQT